ncbi:MAG: hypothetical protein HPY70_13195 [Firmicutes bacterium]|nr:hypothetical protein [Bacillota bacterium]
MLLEMFDIYLFRQFSSILLVGLVIKIMDDIIDENYPEYLYKAALPYAIIIFVISTLIEHKTAISLFMSSYIVGMFSDINETLLTGLKGYQESLIIFGLGTVFLGWKEFIFSLTIIIGIQLIDDVIDVSIDRNSGQRNMVMRYGKVEIFIVSMIFFVFSLMLNPVKGAIILVVAPLVNTIFDKLKGVIINWQQDGL